MVKVKHQEREFEIEEGELVLLVRGVFKKGQVYGQSTPAKVVYLGAFEKVEKIPKVFPGAPERIVLGQCYQLKECEIFGGQSIQLVSPYEYPKSHGLSLSLDLYVGKEDIVAALEKIDSMKPHTEWIRKLEKPYTDEHYRNRQ